MKNCQNNEALRGYRKQVPSMQTGPCADPDAWVDEKTGRITGTVMFPQPGMNAEKRPASPPAINKWILSGLGTIGMWDSKSRLYQTGRLRLYTFPYR